MLAMIGITATIGRSIFTTDLFTHVEPLRSWILAAREITDQFAGERPALLQYIEGRFAAHSERLSAVSPLDRARAHRGGNHRCGAGVLFRRHYSGGGASRGTLDRHGQGLLPVRDFDGKNRCNAVRCGAHARRISLADDLCYFDVDGMDRDDGRCRKLDSPYAAASRLVQAEHAMRHVGQLSVATRIIRYSKA